MTDPLIKCAEKLDAANARIAELEAFDAPECCNGHDCGCRASTPRDWYEYHLEQAENKLATDRNDALDDVAKAVGLLGNEDGTDADSPYYHAALNDVFEVIRALKSEGEG